jgi:chromosome segregation ATPase
MTTQALHAPAFGINGWYHPRKQPKRAHVERLQREIDQLRGQLSETRRALKNTRAERDDARLQRKEAEARAAKHARRWKAAVTERNQLRREADTLHRMHGHAAVIAEHIHITAHDGTALVSADDLQQLLAAVGVIRNITGGME